MVLERIRKFTVPVLFVIFLFQALCFAWDNGQTVDETFFAGSAYPIVRHNFYKIMGEHPPLAIQLGGLPLLIIQPKYDLHDPIYLGKSKEIDNHRMGSRMLYGLGNNAQLLLFLQRLGNIFLALVLAVTLYKWSLQISGWGGGVLSLALFTFSPNMIMNSAQFMTDMAISTFFFLACYRMKSFFKLPTVKNALFLGLTAGLALMSKMTGLILIPVTFLLFTIFLFRNNQAEQGNAHFDFIILVLSFILYSFSLGQKIIYVALSPLCLMIFSVTLFTKKRAAWAVWLERFMWFGSYLLGAIFIAMIAEKRDLPIAVSGAGWMVLMLVVTINLRSRFNNKNVIALSKLFAFVWFIATLVIAIGYTDFFSSLTHWNIFGHYVRAFNIASHHVFAGHGGCVPNSFVTCDWKHFATAILVRTPVISLTLMLIGFVTFSRMKVSAMERAIILIPPISLFFFSSFTNRIFLGIRHILPVYPFLFLLAGTTMPIIHKMSSQMIKRVIFTVLFLSLGFSLARSALTTPHQISYFNEFVGDAERGARVMYTHAGQDHKRLAQAVRAHGIQSIKIGGMNNNVAEFNYLKLPWVHMEETDFRYPASGYYAIDLDVHHRELVSNPNYWFRDKKPIFRAGKTINVYKVD